MLTMRYQVLQYGQSQYFRQFGMGVPNPSKLVELDARILEAPRLKYNPASKQPNVVCTFPFLGDKMSDLHKATEEWHMEFVGHCS